MPNTDWDIRTGIASAVDDRALEEMWPPRELSHRSPRQDAQFLGQSASRRDAHISHVNMLDGALLQKLFRATVEEQRRAAAEGKVTTSKTEIKPSEKVGQSPTGVGLSEREGFYLPSDLVAQGKTILKTMPEPATNPESIIARKAAQEPAAAQGETSAVLAIPAQRPAVATTLKKAAKKAAKKAKLGLEQDEQQPELSLALEDGKTKTNEKKSKQGKGKAQKIPSEHAVDARSWIELGESNIPPRDDDAGSQRKSDILSTHSQRDCDVRESGKSASRSSHKEASPHWPDHADSFHEEDQPRSEASQSKRGSEKKRSATSRAGMQATVESVASHASTKVRSEHSRDPPASREIQLASNKSERNSSASRQALETVWSRNSAEDNNGEEAKYEDGWHDHSSMTSFGRSFVGVPIYGIVSTPGGQEGVVSAPQVSNISELASEPRHNRHRPTVFAGKGWISPHPLSRSPTDLRSPPAPMIILPSQADPQGATMTYEEWQAIQENGLRKHRNFSFTESSQTWHARQQEERYRFPGWEARSWVAVDPSPVDVREDSAHSEHMSGGSDRTVRTIGSNEVSRRSGSAVRTMGSDEESLRSGSAVHTSRSDEESRRSESAMSRGSESRHSTKSYQPKEPTSSPSELLGQEMEEGNGGWS
ncbi:hypothetical protein TI39_contig685g00011 [Zymoseptoria brevis]|uniref:Uncharacterized protein n=1 Tax=Zymoseptoria brevis TaxID=1047168 RepID=A0A0F4GJA1_9PEZI|nr:hypothetical protein TI39_contig685g00011 [Zymoseptoria brevis]